MATIDELEARVAALEAAAAADEYTIQQSGETIDSILAGIKDAAIYHGTTTVTSYGSSATATAEVELDFTPTANTKIIGSVRRNSQSGITPYNNTGGILSFVFYSSKITAVLTYGPNINETLYNLPSGTYYIDWICIDTGEGVS